MSGAVTIRISHKQGRFLLSERPELLYAGGIRSGKTVAFCLKAVHRASHPNAREVIARLTLEDFRRTTLRTLIQGEGEFPPILPAGTYTHNRSEKWIRIHGGGLIEYMGLDERAAADRTRMKIGGLGITGGGIDQVEECTERHYSLFLSRMSARVTGLRPQLYCTANPAPPSHWLVSRFGIEATAPDRTRQTARTEFIHTTPFDNEHLSDDYRQIIAGMRGVERRRLVDGLWVGSDHMVYPGWSRDLHVRESKAGGRSFVFMDDGTSNPACILRAVVDQDGLIHVEREVQRPGMLAAEKVRVVQSMRPFEAVIIDPAAAQMKAELRAAGFAVIDGHNDIELGIGHCTEMLAGQYGVPSLTVDPSCVTLVRQIESYERDPDTGKPIKKNDHGPDALRYGVMHFRVEKPVVFDSASLTALESGCQAPRIGELDAGAAIPATAIRMRDGKRVRVLWEDDAKGTARLWGEPNRPGLGPFCVFVVSGEGGNPTIIAASDATRRDLIYEWAGEATTGAAAMQIAMLNAYLTTRDGPPGVEVFENPSGKVLVSACTSVGVSAGLWGPTAAEFAEAVGALRADLEGGMWREQSRAFFADAKQYVWRGKTVSHFAALEESGSRMIHTDRVISRAGLLRMTDAAGPAPSEPDTRGLLST